MLTASWQSESLLCVDVSICSRNSFMSAAVITIQKCLIQIICRYKKRINLYIDGLMNGKTKEVITNISTFYRISYINLVLFFTVFLLFLIFFIFFIFFITHFTLSSNPPFTYFQIRSYPFHHLYLVC